MKLIAIPTYKDIYHEDAPEISDLLSDIPSKAIIGVFSAINANLFLKPKNKETQIEIFQFITARFSSDQKALIWEGIYPGIEKAKDDFELFNQWYVTEFIQYELLNYKEFDIIDTTPAQEYNIFKAYLIIAEKLNDKHSKIFEKVQKGDDHFKFHRINWPLMVGQFEFNHNIDPTYQAARALVLFNYLENNERTKAYVENFKSITKTKSLKDYLTQIIGLIQLSHTANPDKRFKVFIITTNEDNNLLNSLSINVDCYAKDKSKQIDYKGLRETPILKIDDRTFYIMNWGFLYNQLYTGFLFDFYSRSGIKEIFATFPDFKSQIGERVSEKLFFQKIINRALSKKHSVLFFDEKGEDGLPDCYYRIGKYIFLIEFKDYLMPGKVISSMDFDLVRQEIDKKFVQNEKQEKKGILQQLEQIQKLNERCFGFDDFEKKDIKKRNVIVFPIIVYTNFMYSIPGINDYLNVRFNEKLGEVRSQQDISFIIKDVTLINFYFFYSQILSLQKDIRFIDLINKYRDTINTRQKKSKKYPTVDNVLNSFASFEEIIQMDVDRRKIKAQISELFDCLEIKTEDENNNK